jgi:hypothetical protein
LSRNIADCYEAIVKHYEDGDRVFLFGFSRGAYTARCVGGVMSLCGVPTQGPGGSPLPRFGKELRRIADEAVRDVYQHGNGREDPDGRFKRERLEKARRFRAKYGCKEYRSGDGKTVQAQVVPHFIGVFDTVAALGASGWRRVLFGALLEGFIFLLCAVAAVIVKLVFDTSFWYLALGLNFAIGIALIAQEYRRQYKVIHDFEGRRRSWHFAEWKARFYDNSLNPRVSYARHALAIDEARKDFPRENWVNEGAVGPRGQDDREWLVQLWFAGNHSDIGGSYPEDESRLSDIALKWMIDEVSSLKHPLLLEHGRLNLFSSAGGMQHDEIKRAREATFAVAWKEQVRGIDSDAPLHPSVGERFELPVVPHYGLLAPYRPSNLADHQWVKHYYAGSEAASTPQSGLQRSSQQRAPHQMVSKLGPEGQRGHGREN